MAEDKTKIRRFRASSRLHLEVIGRELNAWMDEWNDSDFDRPRGVLQREEYPFDSALEEVCADVQHAIDLLSVEPVDPILRQYREMVAAFRGGFHPDTPTTEYASYPDSYDPHTVFSIMTSAKKAGYDLYSEALTVMNEAMGSGDLS